MEVRKLARRAAKSTAAAVVHYSGLRSAMAAIRRFRCGGRRVLIVSYHRVVEDFTEEVRRSIPGLLISKKTFQRHLQEARSAGYEFVTLGEALDVMAGRKVARRDLCVVTFDDGYRDVFLHAAPIMRQMGVPAMLYLPSGMIGTHRRFNHDRLFHLVSVLRERGQRPVYEALPPSAAVLLGPVLAGQKSLSAGLDDFIGEYPSRALTELIDALEHQLGGGDELRPVQGDIMGWDDVRAWVRWGFDVGAHTVDHTVLTLESPQAIRRQLREGRERLEEEIGRPVVDFAYCNGWYSDEVIRALVETGYRSAVTTEDYPNRLGDDPFTLKRKVLWENFSQGITGYSGALTVCQLDDVFGALGMSHPVPGKRPQRRLEGIGE